jgi:hypothetical protein
LICPLPVSDGHSIPWRAIVADQKNRGGQKQGNQNPQQPEQAQGTNTGGAAERDDKDKQRDQRNNPDDARRQPTDQTR